MNTDKMMVWPADINTCFDSNSGALLIKLSFIGSQVETTHSLLKRRRCAAVINHHKECLRASLFGIVLFGSLVVSAAISAEMVRVIFSKKGKHDLLSAASAEVRRQGQSWSHQSVAIKAPAQQAGRESTSAMMTGYLGLV